MKRLLPLILLLAAESLYAQPAVNLQRVVNHWPAIDVYFSIACNGQPAYLYDISLLRLTENDIEIKDGILYSPPPNGPTPVFTSVVLDASSNLTGAGNTAAIQAANAWADAVDSTQDSTAVFWFNQTAVLRQDFTTSKPLLHAAIDSLPASGNAAMWDGVYAGMQALGAKSGYSCKVLILLTNGVDNASTHTLSECISYANAQYIRVYAFGVGSNVQTSLLMSLADNTGGRLYVNPSGPLMQSVYQGLCNILFPPDYQSSWIRYASKCMDGTKRVLTLSNANFCGPAISSDTASFRAPRDSASFTEIRIGLPGMHVRGDGVVRVPLELRDVLSPGDIFHPAVFTVLFDAAKARFDSISVPAGSLFAGIPITSAPVPGGVEFRTLSRKIIDSSPQSGLLMELLFRASDPEGTDTVVCPLTLDSWTFSAGCFDPVLESGSLRIVPRRPLLRCAVDMPDSLQWLQWAGDYHPNPLHVGVTLYNDGDGEALNARCRIVYNANDVSLPGSQSDTMVASPVNVAPYGSATAAWDLAVALRMIGKSVQICVESFFDNAPPLQVCWDVWVPPSGPMLSCTVSAPVIKADRVNLRYTPMPFDVTVLVLNSGGQRTDSVRATIIVPPDLQLTGPDLNRSMKTTLPAILYTGQQGAVSWTLRHPVTQVQKEYVIGIRVKTANADSSSCEVRVIVPPLEGPALVPQCSAPDSLHYIESPDEYTPNPFTVSLTCVNRGGLPASNVTCTLQLPPHVELVNSAESLRRVFPTPMHPWKQGDSIPVLTWTVWYTDIFHTDTELPFRFRVAGIGPTGLPADTVESTCNVRLSQPPPLLDCELILPDSLRGNATSTDLEPNPFTVRYLIQNDSFWPIAVSKVVLTCDPGDGLTIDPSTPQTRVTNQTLPFHDTLALSWSMSAQNRVYPRNPVICVSAFANERVVVRCCDTLPIAPLNAALTCDAMSSDYVIRFDTAKGSYTNASWVITATIGNPGTSPFSNVSAEIELADPRLNALVEFDPAFPDNTNPKRIAVHFPQAWKPLQWGYRLRRENGTGHTIVPEFRIRYTATGLPLYTIGCSVPVEVESVPGSRLDSWCDVPDTLRFDAATRQHVPDPFDARVNVVNRGFLSARNAIATIVLPAGMMPANPGETATKALTPLTLDRYAGGPAPTLNWRLRYAGVPAADTCLEVAFAISGIDTLTNAIVHASSSCTVCVEAVTILHDARTPSAREGYALHQNIPNPFSSSTTIQFELPSALQVRLSIFDALGRKVAELVNDLRDAGRHAVTFEAGALPSGTYLCRYEAEGVILQRLLSILR